MDFTSELQGSTSKSNPVTGKEGTWMVDHLGISDWVSCTVDCLKEKFKKIPKQTFQQNKKIIKLKH